MEISRTTAERIAKYLRDAAKHYEVGGTSGRLYARAALLTREARHLEKSIAKSRKA